MKFSGNGLYIEEYTKCDNCGYLIYEADLDKVVKSESEQLFCSEWCQNWFLSKKSKKYEKRM
tara:strand:+ start:406 stop:591 length:186 start_codon:yes stop_codon:yes gene_type:complete